MRGRMTPTEIRKSILIVKSQPKSLAAAETFLRNRGWKIHSAVDLKDALQFLVQGKPSFVMISVDHPNKKVRTLPKLLVQSFPVFVIGFAESNSTLAYKALIDSGAPYRINPPVTGPAIERTINKIVRDQEIEREKKAAAERSNRMAKASGARELHKPGEKAVSFVGVDGVLPNSNDPAEGFAALGGEPGEGGMLTGFPSGANGEATPTSSKDDFLAHVERLSEGGGESDADAESALLSALQSAAGSETSASGEDEAGLFTAPDKTASASEFGEPGALGGSRHQKGPAYMPSHRDDGDSSAAPGAFIERDGRNFGAAGGDAEATEASEAGGRLEARKRRKGAGGSQGPETDSGEADALGHGVGRDSVTPESSDSDGDVVLQKSKASHGLRGPGDIPRTSSDQAMPYYEEPTESEKLEGGTPDKVSADVLTAKDKPAATYDVNEAESLASKLEPTGVGPGAARKVGSSSRGWQKEENIIVRGTQKALDDSVQVVGTGEVKQKLEGSSNVACLVVESERFSGYLVAALGKNRRIDNGFIDTLKDRLSKFLKDNGEPMKDDASMQLKIKAVDFEDWALEYADFLRKSVHEGEEIAMAFFPFQEAKTVMETSAQADMGAVKLDELQGDLSVDFNLYVYLPANKKYVLYTPRGSKFYGNQKDRLARMGVTHMHVKRTELQDVSKYRAQNYLNSKIQEYEKKKSAKRAS